jgi:hypothetical protein
VTGVNWIYNCEYIKITSKSFVKVKGLKKMLSLYPLLRGQLSISFACVNFGDKEEEEDFFNTPAFVGVYRFNFVCMFVCVVCLSALTAPKFTSRSFWGWLFLFYKDYKCI